MTVRLKTNILIVNTDLLDADIIKTENISYFVALAILNLIKIHTCIIHRVIMKHILSQSNKISS